MLYTRRGDKGTTGLFGTSERLPKNSPIYKALGDVDELNSLLGICRVRSGPDEKAMDTPRMIRAVQECLFIIQAEIAGAGKSIGKIHIDVLEKNIDRVEKLIPKSSSFVIPGATSFSALCDYARAVARRAERTVWGIRSERNISRESAAYLNRLSSFLYVLARYSVAVQGVHESPPSYQ